MGLTKTRKTSPLLWLKVGSIAAIVLATSVVVLEITNVTNFFHKKATSGIIPSSNPEVSLPSEDKSDIVPSSDTTVSPQDPKQDPQTTATPTGTQPIPPYGNFVSNHHPSLSGSAEMRKEVSVCNTSPGANCYIAFTNQDGVVKKLALQKTDGSGATYWNWDIGQAGLTVGSWKITVYAILNGQTKTTDDVQNLEIGS